MVPPCVLTKGQGRNKEAKQEIEHLQYQIMLREEKITAAKQPAEKETKAGKRYSPKTRMHVFDAIQCNVFTGAISQLCTAEMLLTTKKVQNGL